MLRVKYKAMGRHWEDNRQTLGRHWADIGQTLGRHWADIGQTLGRYCADIVVLHISYMTFCISHVR